MSRLVPYFSILISFPPRYPLGGGRGGGVNWAIVWPGSARFRNSAHMSSPVMNEVYACAQAMGGGGRGGVMLDSPPSPPPGGGSSIWKKQPGRRQVHSEEMSPTNLTPQ